MTSAPDSPEALVLRDLAWVRSLARRLLGDPALADDIAHEAWLEARTAPPARVDGGLRGWLATVVRHRVQRLRRGDRRQRAREARVAGAAATASDADVVERAAMHRELMTVVMELDEPLRSAVLLRYLDGLSTEEVAARQGITPVAARKRLSRALQALRERLGRSHAGGFAAWSLAWRGQLGLAPATTAPSFLLPFTILMQTKWLTALVAAVFALWLSSRWWGTPAANGLEVAPPGGAIAVGGETDAPPAAADPAVRVTADGARGCEVVDDLGRARGGVTVLALADGALAQRAVTDAAGRVAFAVAADELLVAAPGHVPVRLPRDAAAARQRVVLPTGAVVDGEVVRFDADETPVELRLEHDRVPDWDRGLDTAVREVLAELGVSATALRVTIGADRRFRFAGLPHDWTGALAAEGAWTLEEQSGLGHRDAPDTLLLLGAARGLRLVLSAPFRLRGRLRAGDAPAAGLHLHAMVPHLQAGAALPAASSRADGTFVLGVPRPPRVGAWRGELLVGSADGDNLLQRRFEVAAGDAEVDVGDLEVGRAVGFFVAGADGEPLPGAVVRVLGDDGTFVAASTDADGRTRVFGVPATVRSTTVRAHGHRTAEVALPRHGDVDVRLERGNGVDVTVRARGGRGVADLRLRVECDRLPFVVPGAEGAAAQPFARTFALDDDGQLRLGDLVPGVLLQLAVVDELEHAVGRAEVVAPPIARVDRVELVVTAPGFVVEGRVRDEQGRPVPRARVHVERGGVALAARSDADGRFVLGPLRAPWSGAHVEVTHPAFVTWLRDDVALAADAVLDVRIERGRTVRARLRQPDGAPVAAGPAVDVWIAFADAPTALGRAGEDGDVRFDRVPTRPGRLVVRIGGREWSQAIDAFAADVAVALPGLGQLHVRGGAAARAGADERVCVVVTPLVPAGDVVRQYFPRDADAADQPLVLPLAAGRYRVAGEARRLGGGRARVRTLGEPTEIEVTTGGVVQVVLP